MKLKVTAIALALSLLFSLNPNLAGIDSIDTSRTQSGLISPNEGLELPLQFTVLIWNVAKTPGSVLEQTPFYRAADIKILQEYPLSQTESPFAKGYTGLVTTGVANLSRYRDSGSYFIQSVEPILRTPKALIATEYPLHTNSDQSLLVINLHGVNFSWSFERWNHQINQAIALANAHEGPVILAGDFNTWRKARRDLLIDLTEASGLIPHIPTPDTRTSPFGYALDWIFTRGIQVNALQVQESDLSDHNALLVELSIAPNP